MLSDLLQHNKQWAADKKAEEPLYFDRLKAIQNPDYLWIGCSDSRVPANVITGLEPGEVFVHRNVANLVHPGDINMLSVVEYAVEVLAIKHIIVCGHYGCGGIGAAVDGERHGIVDHWLQPIRDTAERNAESLDAIEDKETRLNRLCELNIAAQIHSLSRTPVIQQAWQRGISLSIHGWVYGLHDGMIRDLDCTVSQK